MLNKIVLAILGVTTSSMAIAGSMGTVCSPGPATVPCESKSWDIGIQALYLRPVYDADRGYFINGATTLPEIETNWDWGYQIEGSYHFNTGSDLSLNWTHFHDTTTVLNATASIILPTFNYFARNQFDQVNLEMGQLTYFGASNKMRFYGGLQYANIKLEAAQYFNPPLQVTTTFDKTDFKGVGPVVGIDYSYQLSNSLSITANSSGSILYGSSRFDNGFIFAPLNVVLVSQYGSKKAIVPSLEAKLGLNYMHPIAQGTLNIEGGYQALNYFNALQANSQGLFALVLGNRLTNSDYGLYGPYLGVKYTGAA